MANIAYIFFCYILFFSLHANKLLVFVNGARVAKNAPNCSGTCAPSSQKKSSANSTHVFLQDELRVTGIGNGAKDSFLYQSMSAGLYTVTVGFGSPAKNYRLILDTGSSITWVRCPKKPNNSNLLYYYPSNSSSSVTCIPKLKYLDKSSCQGSFVHDTITINSYMLPKFAFLCAKKVKGFSEEDHGILGLGQGGRNNEFGNCSLLSQLTSNVGKVFCHCLPMTGNSASLYFGKEALDKCNSATNYTPLKSFPDPYYHVSLAAITIGTRRLEISSSTIIDSGTVISRLPSSVYLALRSEFKTLMSKYPSAPSPDKTLDTCYNLQGINHDFPKPSMVLHLENLDVNLDHTTIFWMEKDLTQVCLAFAKKQKEGDPTIIGNHQLQKLNVLYDIQNQRIGIGPGNC